MWSAAFLVVAVLLFSCDYYETVEVPDPDPVTDTEQCQLDNIELRLANIGPIDTSTIFGDVVTYDYIGPFTCTIRFPFWDVLTVTDRLCLSADPDKAIGTVKFWRQTTVLFNEEVFPIPERRFYNHYLQLPTTWLGVTVDSGYCDTPFDFVRYDEVGKDFDAFTMPGFGIISTGEELADTLYLYIKR